MKNKKIYRNKFFIKKHCLNHEEISESCESFKTIKDTEEWSLQKISSISSMAWVTDTRLHFGVPPVSQVIYPGQTFRVSTGWKVVNIPDQMSMHIFPSERLLSYGIFSFPKILNKSQEGSEVTQILYNNNDYPIILGLNLKNQGQSGAMYMLKDEEFLEFDIGEMFQSALGIASAVLPFLL